MALELTGRQRWGVLLAAGDRREEGFCYLWTLTCAEWTGPRELVRLWSNLQKRLVEDGAVGVRVLERGEKGERRWHLHLVTRQRWDVNRVRELSTREGFGRIHVRKIPLEKAGYVAKYVTKRGDAEEGVRMWSCFGWSGSRVRDIRITQKVDQRSVMPSDGLVDAVRWVVEGFDPVEITLREPVTTEYVPRQIKQMELKANQIKEVVADVCSGHVVFVGEYRGFAVRKLAYTDKRSGQKIERAVVEHNVEVAGVARLVTEWLPQGADGSAVKAAANRGDVVKVHVSGMKAFSGQTTFTGAIKSLTQLV